MNARARSLVINTGRRRRRSTHTPTTRLNRRIGRNCTALRTPISKGAACSVVIAMNGIASSLTCVPSWLTEVAIHRFQKPPRSAIDDLVDGSGHGKESREGGSANLLAHLRFEPVEHLPDRRRGPLTRRRQHQEEGASIGGMARSSANPGVFEPVKRPRERRGLDAECAKQIGWRLAAFSEMPQHMPLQIGNVEPSK